MADEPLITTVVPTYQRPELLKRAVLSVLNQSYPHFVVRILDNASGDETEQVARELIRRDPRVQYHPHAENIGSLSNFIFGIESTTTPYFSVLPDDDLLMPDLYRTAMAAHRRAEGRLAFVATRAVVVDDRGRLSEPFPYPKDRSRYEPPEGVLACLQMGVSMPGAVYNTRIMQAVGPFRPSWWNWTESGWNALAAIDNPIEFTREVGAIVYVHPDSGSKQMGRVEFRLSWFRMLAELRVTAAARGLGDPWWQRHVRPLAYSRFLATAARFCTREGSRHYGTLGNLAVAAGIDRRLVSAALGSGRLVAVLGVGRLANAAFDRGRTISKEPSRP